MLCLKSSSLHTIQNMELNVNHLVRSAVAGAVLIPLSFSVARLVPSPEKVSNVKQETVSKIKGDLAMACIKFQAAKTDSKLERESKTEIDEILGGDVNHRQVCNWVF